MRALERPALPSIERRLRWTGRVVAVLGRGAAAFAERLASAARARSIDARVVEVVLRHREGSSSRGERDLHLACAPDALLEALESVAPAQLSIGVGAAFAAAVEPDLSIWIRAGESPITLGAIERRLAGEARLVLEEARPGVADALAAALVEDA